MTESQIQDQIRLVLGSDPRCAFFRNNCGVAQRNGHTIRFGVGSPGGADLIGVFNGRFIAVEIKTPVGRQTPEQKLFQQLIERKGGVYIILRSAEEARQWLAVQP